MESCVEAVEARAAAGDGGAQATVLACLCQESILTQSPNLT